MLLLVSELSHAAILLQLQGAALQHNLCRPLDMQASIDDFIHAAGQGVEVEKPLQSSRSTAANSRSQSSTRSAWQGGTAVNS